MIVFVEQEEIQTKVGRRIQKVKNFAKNFTPKNLLQRGRNIFKSYQGVKGIGKGLLKNIDDAAKSFMKRSW